MVVNMISGGDSAFRALAHTIPDQRLIQHLGNNINNLKTTLGNVGTRFIENAQNMYERFNNSAAISAAKNALFASGMAMNEHTIYPVRLDRWNDANLIMQRYILSEPTVNKLYVDNMCNGFEATQVDNDPGFVGSDRSDYRRVMDGVLYFDKDGTGLVTHYTNDDDIDDLDFMDKLAVLDTWDNAKLLLAQGIDPTDPDGNEL